MCISDIAVHHYRNKRPIENDPVCPLGRVAREKESYSGRVMCCHVLSVFSAQFIVKIVPIFKSFSIKPAARTQQ